MRRYIIASHGKFSYGIKNSLEMIIGERANIDYICAYVNGNNESVDNKIKEMLKKVQDDDEVIVFTDILGGSITNLFLKYAKKKNIHIIAGTNLPLVLEVVTSEDLPIDVVIKNSINSAKESIVYLNKLIEKM